MLNDHDIYIYILLYDSLISFYISTATLLLERDLELSNRSLQERVAALSQLEQKLEDSRALHEQEKQALLAQQGEEHSKQLAQVDERIRKILAAKDTELSNLKGLLRSKEAKLKTTEDALAQINREIVGVRKR